MNRQAVGWAFAILLLIPCATMAQGDKKTPNILEEMKRRENAIKVSEARKDWKKISWRSTAAEAVADATMSNKPLLIVLIVGELGRPKAERC